MFCIDFYKNCLLSFIMFLSFSLITCEILKVIPTCDAECKKNILFAKYNPVFNTSYCVNNVDIRNQKKCNVIGYEVQSIPQDVKIPNLVNKQPISNIITKPPVKTAKKPPMSVFTTSVIYVTQTVPKIKPKYTNVQENIPIIQPIKPVQPVQASIQVPIYTATQPPPISVIQTPIRHVITSISTVYLTRTQQVIQPSVYTVSLPNTVTTSYIIPASTVRTTISAVQPVTAATCTVQPCAIPTSTLSAVQPVTTAACTVQPCVIPTSTIRAVQPVTQSYIIPTSTIRTTISAVQPVTTAACTVQPCVIPTTTISAVQPVTTAACTVQPCVIPATTINTTQQQTNTVCNSNSSNPLCELNTLKKIEKVESKPSESKKVEIKPIENKSKDNCYKIEIKMPITNPLFGQYQPYNQLSMPINNPCMSGQIICIPNNSIFNPIYQNYQTLNEPIKTQPIKQESSTISTNKPTQTIKIDKINKIDKKPTENKKQITIKYDKPQNYLSEEEKKINKDIEKENDVPYLRTMNEDKDFKSTEENREVQDYEPSNINEFLYNQIYKQIRKNKKKARDPDIETEKARKLKEKIDNLLHIADNSKKLKDRVLNDFFKERNIKQSLNAVKPGPLVELSDSFTAIIPNKEENGNLGLDDDDVDSDEDDQVVFLSQLIQ